MSDIKIKPFDKLPDDEPINILEFLKETTEGFENRDQAIKLINDLGVLYGLSDENYYSTYGNLMDICELMVLTNEIQKVAKRYVSKEEVKEFLYPQKFEGMFYVDEEIFLKVQDGTGISLLDIWFMDSYLIGCQNYSLNVRGKTYLSSTAIFFLKESQQTIFESFKKGKLKSQTYLLWDSISGYYKIGKSIAPSKRIQHLSSGSPNLTVLMSCKENIETKLHRKFSSKRIKGEWFNLSECDLLEIIDEFKAVGGEFFNANQNK